MGSEFASSGFSDLCHADNRYLTPFPLLNRKGSKLPPLFFGFLRSMEKVSFAPVGCPASEQRKVIMQKILLAPASGMPSCPVHLTLPSFPTEQFSLNFAPKFPFVLNKRHVGIVLRLVRKGEVRLANKYDNWKIYDLSQF